MFDGDYMWQLGVGDLAPMRLLQFLALTYFLQLELHPRDDRSRPREDLEVIGSAISRI